MNLTPIEILLSVSDAGGRLEPLDDGRLKMVLPADFSPEVKTAIKESKAILIELLKLNIPFLVVRADCLKDAVIWTTDETAKVALVRYGAKPGLVYTKRELAEIVEQNPTIETLCQILACKQVFDGRICYNPNKQ